MYQGHHRPALNLGTRCRYTLLILLVLAARIVVTFAVILLVYRALTWAVGA